MTDASGGSYSGSKKPKVAARPSSRLTRLVASRGFQKWAARFPLTRRIVRREGDAMFDLVAGFCHSQILLALVRLDIPAMLLEQEMPLAEIAARVDLPLRRAEALMAGGAALGLVKQRRNGLYHLTTRGAALVGVPGLSGMIAHHDVLYRDLADPVAFFRGEVETELADFWPYVFGASGAQDPAVTATYSRLMSDSQTLVAEDTLATISLSDTRHLMDVGGGTGAFLEAVGAAYPQMRMTLFDLPAVAPSATSRFAAAGMSDRVTIASGSFRDDSLPVGADTISLVRVLYDHADETVRALLSKVHDTLPEGGRVIISEPMTGGDTPHRAGDAYFALYCMAMRTGRARSPAQIAAALTDAGFAEVTIHPAKRPFITSVVTAVKQS